jgi:hypothetical protein
VVAGEREHVAAAEAFERPRNDVGAAEVIAHRQSSVFKVFRFR